MRVIYFTFSMYIITHIFVFITIPFAILISYFDKNMIPSIKRWFVKSLYLIVGKKLKITGYKNVKPGKNYLIIANYPGFYAGFSLIGTFPNANVVANAFLMKIPLLSQILQRLGAIFVYPKKAGPGRQAIDVFLSDQGRTPGVIIFPEGERTVDGLIHRFRLGFLYILRNTSLDLLPVTLNGLYQLKPMKRFYLDPDAEPEIVIHEAINNSDVRKMKDIELVEVAHSIISKSYRP